MYGYGYNRGGRSGGFRRRPPFHREMTEITCAQCGKKDTVPFKPREGSEVLCKECFMKKKGITPREPRKEEVAEEEAGEETEEVEEAGDEEETEEAEE